MIALVLALAAGPAVAGANTPSKAQYSSQQQVLGAGGSGGSGDASTGSGLSGRVGPLPFTGFDVLSMAAVALGVTGLGLVLGRAVARRPDTEPGS